MKPPSTDPSDTRRDRFFLAAVGVVLGGLAAFAIWTFATWLLACLAVLCLGLAAFGADRTVARVANLFIGWP